TALLCASGDARRRASGSEEAGCDRRDNRRASRQKAVPPSARPSMRGKKRAIQSKKARRSVEGSKLAEAFLARLDRAWQQHGREILDRVLAERPELYFQALVRLTVVLHRRLPEPLIGASIVRTYCSDCRSARRREVRGRRLTGGS